MTSSAKPGSSVESQTAALGFRCAQSGLLCYFRSPMRLDSVTDGTRANAARRRERSMQSHRRHILRLAAGALALPAIARTAAAESFPSRPVTIIVPFAPGALNDIVARQLSDAMGKALGQPVIIENVTGADGTIATNRR